MYQHENKTIKTLKSRGGVVLQKKNSTGLPDTLKSGIENLSGYAMDDVKVHYNSDKPAQLNAHAYAQGTDIHLGSGQEKHLPHEAWHVVQQKQGRVKPTMQMNGKVNINDDVSLEKEANVMGAKAKQFRAMPDKKSSPLLVQRLQTNNWPVQRSVNVYPKERKEGDEITSVVIKADGKVSKFEDGNAAKNKGWNGVEKYKARFYINDKGLKIGPLNNDYLVAQAGHVLAQQNGGLGSDEDNVFAQDGGINNSTYRTHFENPMRKALNEANDNDKVSFRAVLYGRDITQGDLSKDSDMIIASSEESDGTSSDED